LTVLKKSSVKAYFGKQSSPVVTAVHHSIITINTKLATYQECPGTDCQPEQYFNLIIAIGLTGEQDDDD